MGHSATTHVAVTVGVERYDGVNKIMRELEIFYLYFFLISYLLRKELSLLRTNLLASKLIKNCSSVSFLCLVSLKLPFKMQILRSLILWPSALKCDRRGRSFFCLI